MNGLYILLGISMAVAAFSVPRKPPAVTPVERDAAIAAENTLIVHHAALRWAVAHPAHTGIIPRSGAGSLQSFLPPGFAQKPGFTVNSEIGSAADRRPVVSWIVNVDLASDIATAMIGFSDASPGTGLVSSTRELVSAANGAAGYQFPPSANGGVLPPTPFAAVVTYTLP